MQPGSESDIKRISLNDFSITNITDYEITMKLLFKHPEEIVPSDRVVINFNFHPHLMTMDNVAAKINCVVLDEGKTSKRKTTA